MKLIKTDWRSRLTDTHLSDLMQVHLEGAEIPQFDPKKAIHLWYSNSGGSRTRRLDFVSNESALNDGDSDLDDDLDVVQVDRELTILSKMQELEDNCNITESESVTE